MAEPQESIKPGCDCTNCTNLRDEMIVALRAEVAWLSTEVCRTDELAKRAQMTIKGLESVLSLYCRWYSMGQPLMSGDTVAYELATAMREAFQVLKCDCIASGNASKPKQHGADPHAKNCKVYRNDWPISQA